LTLFFSLSDSEALRALLNLIESPILVKDRTHRFVLANQAACELLGRPQSDIIGRADHDFFPREQADIYVANDRRVFETGHPNENEELLTDGSGRVRTLLTRKSLLKLVSGEEFVAVYITDVSDFRGAELQIGYNAEHDALTGLANMACFQRQLQALLEPTPQDRRAVGLLLIDLHRFRNVNNALGRAAGDNLLVQFAKLLSEVAGPTDLVARLGGDEFAIVQGTLRQPTAATALAASILERLRAPLFFNGRRVRMLATIGIASAGQNGDFEALLRRADLALQHAKREGGAGWRSFEPHMEASGSRGSFLEEDLRVALQQGQFSVVYQPLARVADLEVLGYEALLRWTHPVLGPIEPSVFIPLAETEGFIVSIGEWVLRQACATAARWPKPVGIAVNVSPVQFARTDLPDLVRKVVDETGIEPHRIELEVTETSVIGDIEAARRVFESLHAVGVRIVLDDFGAGYSSLEVLKALPFDKIKLDKSLLRDVGCSRKADAVISALLRMSRALDLQVVAEGVETIEQVNVLKREKCAVLQGFFLSRPVDDPFRKSSRSGPLLASQRRSSVRRP
jgi:diguanylate cyclase (GGDEF)-like protein/PAS domain S-box-containing protein